MSQAYAFMKTVRDGLTTIVITEPSGTPHTINSNNPSFKDVLALWREGKKELAVQAMSVKKAISNYTNGAFEISDNQVKVNGRVVPALLADYVLDYKQDELDYLPLVRFAENLFLNPSFRSVQQLFAFLQKNNQPITDDGCFIAYKRVDDNFLDLHSHTLDNSPGKVVKMERNEVNDNPNETCSNGLHVANWLYANEQYAGSRGVMLAVKVNPRDVVAVPVDYNQAKMRVCEYLVLEVVKETVKDKLVVTSGFSTPTGPVASYPQSLDSTDDDERVEEEEEEEEEDFRDND